MLKTLSALVILGIMPNPASAFIMSSVDSQRILGPEISQVPIWEVGIVQAGDEFEKTICLPFVQKLDLKSFGPGDCLREIAQVNNLSLRQLDHIIPGERYWVPAIENTASAIDVQRRSRLSLGFVDRNPLYFVLGLQELRAEMKGMHDSLSGIEASTLNEEEIIRLIDKTVAEKLSNFPAIDAVSSDHLSRAMQLVTKSATEKALAAAQEDAKETSRLVARVDNNETNIILLKNELADIADKTETSSQIVTSLSIPESPFVVQWWQWIAIVVGLVLFFLLLLYFLLKAITKKVIVGKIEPLEKKVDRVQTALELQSTKVDMLYTAFQEDTGYIANLPSQSELESLPEGGIVKVFFNHGKDQLTFKVEKDHRSQGPLGLRVQDWPLDWPPKRSIYSLRRQSIVAVVKEYTAKNDSKNPSLRQAG